MAAKSDITDGTITLTNGEAGFTGTDTFWALADIREGDAIFNVVGATQYNVAIASIENDTAGTLVSPWEGPTITAAYRIRYMADGQRSTAQGRNLVQLLGNGRLTSISSAPGSSGVIEILPGGAAALVPKVDLINGVAVDKRVNTMAQRAAYDAQADQFSVYVSDVGDAFGPDNAGRAATFFRDGAVAGVWSDPAYVTGPKGPLPDVSVGAVTTGNPGTSVIVTGTPITGGVELDFTIPAGRGPMTAGDYDADTAYILDDVVQYNGSSWIALQVTTGNAPPTLPTTSNAYWQLLARQGIDGSGTVSSVVAGSGITVDSADPTAPIVAINDEAAVLFDRVQPLAIADRTQAHMNLGSALVLISEQTVTNAADVRFPDLSAYDQLALEFEASPHSAASYLYYRTSPDNFVTLRDGATDYYYHGWYGTSSIATLAGLSASLGYLCNFLVLSSASSPTEGNKFEWSITDFNKISNKSWKCDNGYVASGGVFARDIIRGQCTFSQAQNALLIGAVGEGITGHFRLYGRKG